MISTVMHDCSAKHGANNVFLALLLDAGRIQFLIGLCSEQLLD
jgi:hypothetical protein